MINIVIIIMNILITAHIRFHINTLPFIFTSSTIILIALIPGWPILPIVLLIYLPVSYVLILF
jgi:hypothetical protein